MKFLKSHLFLLGVMILFFSCNEKEFSWQQGDILFQDGDCGDFCEAIRKVTDGYKGIEFSHNGLLMQKNGEWFVLEAIGKGVSKTPLEEFLNRHLDENGNELAVQPIESMNGKFFGNAALERSVGFIAF